MAIKAHLKVVNMLFRKNCKVAWQRQTMLFFLGYQRGFDNPRGDDRGGGRFENREGKLVVYEIDSCFLDWLKQKLEPMTMWFLLYLRWSKSRDTRIYYCKIIIILT